MSELEFMAIMGAAYLGLMALYGSCRVVAWMWSVIDNFYYRDTEAQREWQPRRWV